MMTPSQPQPEMGADLAREMARVEQNFVLAALAGLVTSAVTAVAWAAITAATGYQIGFMAIGVGVAVGLVVKRVGHGLDVSFRILASLLALAGCAGGNLLVACVFFAGANEVGVGRVLELLDWKLAQELMRATFSPMDVLFYALAVWEAWRLAADAPPTSMPAA
jgi:hypothetical protein